MAPQQQNSTFIDDNLDSCPSLLNLPESPILPPRRCQNQDTNNNNNKRAASPPTMVPPFEPPPPLPQPVCKNKHGKANGNGGQARRHRSISLYGVNSTVVSAPHTPYPTHHTLPPLGHCLCTDPFSAQIRLRQLFH